MNDREDTARRGAPQPLISRRDALRAVAGCSVAGFVTPAMAFTAPAAIRADAELLRLGDEFELACAAERAAWLVHDTAGGTPEQEAHGCRASDAVSAIVRRIELSPARSVDGLLVKARAILWCHCGEPLDSKAFNEQATTDVRIAVTVVNDLLAMRVAA